MLLAAMYEHHGRKSLLDFVSNSISAGKNVVFAVFLLEIM